MQDAVIVEEHLHTVEKLLMEVSFFEFFDKDLDVTLYYTGDDVQVLQGRIKNESKQ